MPTWFRLGLFIGLPLFCFGCSDAPSDGGATTPDLPTATGETTPTPSIGGGTPTPTPTDATTPTPSTSGETPTSTPGTPTPTPEQVVPDADFLASSLIGVAPLSLNFKDKSTSDGPDIEAWLWSFGDETTSDEPDPSHTYEQAGTYSVSLTVENSLGSDTLIKDAYITVVAPDDAIDVPAGTLLINEVLANVENAQSAFIEIYNQGEAAVDISAWFLSTDDTQPLNWSIPDGSILAPSSFMAFYPGEDLDIPPEGGRIYLSSATNGHATGYFEDEGYDPLPTGRSQGWHTLSTGDMDFVPLKEPTGGLENAQPFVGDVFISEIHYNPGGENTAEFVELINQGSSAVDLGMNGYAFDDGLDFIFSEGTVLQPGERLVITQDLDAFATEYPDASALGTAFEGKLANSGERLVLTRLENVAGNLHPIAQDRVDYNDKDPWPEQADGLGGSLNRVIPQSYGSDPESWVLGLPSPGQSLDEGPIERLLITELMYHAPSHLTVDDWIEIYNGGEDAINLEGYQFVNGVAFTFPAEMLAPGAYAIVAASPNTFSAAHPGVEHVMGPFVGNLSEKGERIELADTLGNTVQNLRYADQGDWANRTRGPIDHGHEGWIWDAPHDGGGKTLERRSLLLSESNGLNWGSSLSDAGSPGAENTLNTQDTAPLIAHPLNTPPVPSSEDTVTVTANIEPGPRGVDTVNLHWRLDGNPTFQIQPMNDAGSAGDTLASDGVFTAQIPPQQGGSVVEFFIKTTDQSLNSTQWPAKPINAGGLLTNALYQVDGSFDALNPDIPAGQDLYLIVMTEAERLELESIGDGDDPSGVTDEHDSNAQMNATFIALRNGQTSVHHLIGIRNRGNSSRSRPPNNHRLNFRHDEPYRKGTALNINAKYPHAQIAGFRTFQLAGIQSPNINPIQLRINGENLALGDRNMHGSYAAIEPLNGDFVKEHFLVDGNLYRGWERADFKNIGSSETPYSNWYLKQNNEELPNWEDIVDLAQTLDTASDDDYMLALLGRLDVPQWTRWMAMDNLLGNVEHGLVSGEGDDYAAFFPLDEAIQLIPHDNDSVYGQGQYYPDWTYFGYANVAGLARLLNNPEYLQLYHDNIRLLASTVYTPEIMDPKLDEWFSSWVDAETINSMKDFLIERRQKMLEQARGETLIPEDAPWHYFDAHQAPSGDWTSLAYDDSSWSQGMGQFGWGEDGLTTQIDPGGSTSDRPMTVYFRHKFSVQNANTYLGLISRIWRDDGAIIYLNGEELIRREMPSGTIDYDTPASKELQGQSEPWFREDRINDNTLLMDGENILAVEIHQRTNTSVDMRFNYVLRAIPNSPHPDESPEAWADFTWDLENFPLLPWPTRDGQ